MILVKYWLLCLFRYGKFKLILVLWLWVEFLFCVYLLLVLNVKFDVCEGVINLMIFGNVNSLVFDKSLFF